MSWISDDEREAIAQAAGCGCCSDEAGACELFEIVDTCPEREYRAGAVNSYRATSHTYEAGCTRAPLTAPGGILDKLAERIAERVRAADDDTESDQ